MVGDSDRVSVYEISVHTFEGEYPEVPTYEFVNPELLYQGDAVPFHITLRVAEVGRVSANGLLYDEELVSRIEEGLQRGAEGIGGHIPDDQASTAFPISEVFWIGHLRVGETTWAKGYIPPGDRREDIRRKKATHGQIGTSIYGTAIHETANGKKYWRAKEFELDQLDLAPAKRQSLKKAADFVITAETEQKSEEGTDMPDKDKQVTLAEITIGDVPDTIREQIIHEAQIRADAGRVSELEKTISEQEKTIAELASWREIVGEIRTTLGVNNPEDTLRVVTELHTAMVGIAERLGLPTAGIEIRVYEMHERIQEFETQAFERTVENTVAELTPWAAQTDKGKQQLASLRQMMTRRVIGEIGQSRTAEKVAEVAKTLWDTEFVSIAESVRDSLAGPAAIIGGKLADKGSGWKPNPDTQAARGNTGI